VLFVYNSYLADSILPNLRKGFTAEVPQALWRLH